MITAQLTISTQPIEQIQVFLRDYNQIVAEIGDAVTGIVAPHALDELRHTPPAVQYPIEWTSERQRRAFFATNGFGRGIPTKRTGKLGNGWRIIGKSVNGKYQLIISNPVSYLPYVVGSINFRSARQAIQPMQRFHRNTGWQPVQNTVEYWFGVTQDEFNIRYEKTLREFTSRKVVTRTSRKAS